MEVFSSFKKFLLPRVDLEKFFHIMILNIKASLDLVENFFWGT